MNIYIKVNINQSTNQAINISVEIIIVTCFFELV